MTADDIMGEVREMQRFRGTAEERRARFSATKPAFRDACPTLFEMACRPGLDTSMLSFMLRARDRHGAGEENGWAADEAVGRKLADRYLPRA
jgi:hypothetical protein